MKKTFLVFALLTLTLFAFGQTNADSIVVKSTFGGCKIYQNNKLMTFTQLESAIQNNELAYSEFKKAKSNNTLASIFGGIGGFLIGYPLGTALAGGNPNWTMAGIGAGFTLISIPISNKFIKQVKTAVTIFNGGQKENTLSDDTEYRFGFTDNGITLSMTF